MFAAHHAAPGDTARHHLVMLDVRWQNTHLGTAYLGDEASCGVRPSRVLEPCIARRVPIATSPHSGAYRRRASRSPYRPTKPDAIALDRAGHQRILAASR
jgi:hypothetical protein